MDIRISESTEKFNVYAHLWLDAGLVRSYGDKYPCDLYVRIIADNDGFLEVEPAGEFNYNAELICPDCKSKYSVDRRRATWIIAKKAILVARIEDKERDQ